MTKDELDALEAKVRDALSNLSTPPPSMTAILRMISSYRIRCAEIENLLRKYENSAERIAELEADNKTMTNVMVHALQLTANAVERDKRIDELEHQLKEQELAHKVLANIPVRKYTCKECGSAGTSPQFIYSMKCAGCWKAYAENMEARVNKSARVQAALTEGRVYSPEEVREIENLVDKRDEDIVVLKAQVAKGRPCTRCGANIVPALVCGECEAG